MAMARPPFSTITAAKREKYMSASIGSTGSRAMVLSRASVTHRSISVLFINSAA